MAYARNIYASSVIFRAQCTGRHAPVDPPVRIQHARQHPKCCHQPGNRHRCSWRWSRRRDPLALRGRQQSAPRAEKFWWFRFLCGTVRRQRNQVVVDPVWHSRRRLRRSCRCQSDHWCHRSWWKLQRRVPRAGTPRRKGRIRGALPPKRHPAVAHTVWIELVGRGQPHRRHACHWRNSGHRINPGHVARAASLQRPQGFWVCCALQS